MSAASSPATGLHVGGFPISLGWNFGREEKTEKICITAGCSRNAVHHQGEHKEVFQRSYKSFNGQAPYPCHHEARVGAHGLLEHMWAYTRWIVDQLPIAL